MRNIKYIPNIITSIRILGSLFLFITEPFSKLFYFIYIMCGISDILDGYIARKTKCISKTGQILDSIADMFFIFIVLFILIPIINLPFYSLLWIGFIFIVRILSLFIGFIKYNSLSALHTYGNKATGLILFLFPILYILWGLSITIYITCTIATLSSIEDLLINISSKELNRDVKSLFKL